MFGLQMESYPLHKFSLLSTSLTEETKKLLPAGRLPSFQPIYKFRLQLKPISAAVLPNKPSLEQPTQKEKLQNENHNKNPL